MAKEKDEKKSVATVDNAQAEESGLRKNNLLADNALDEAIKKISEKKNEEQVREAMIALCAITYYNQKQRAELRKRRREDDIQKEKLDASKKIFERYVGFECEVQKDGTLKKTDKEVPTDQRLTAVEVRDEKDKLNEEIRKKIVESEKQYNKDISELRNSFEGQYRWYDTWD